MERAGEPFRAKNLDFKTSECCYRNGSHTLRGIEWRLSSILSGFESTQNDRERELTRLPYQRRSSR